MIMQMGPGNAMVRSHCGLPPRIMQNEIAFMQLYAKLCISIQKSYAKSCSFANPSAAYTVVILTVSPLLLLESSCASGEDADFEPSTLNGLGRPSHC